MNANNWKHELHRLLEKFERESEISLRKIKQFLKASDRPFDDNFRQYFLKMLTLKFDTSFNIVRFERTDENSMRMTSDSTAPAHDCEIASSTNTLSNTKVQKAVDAAIAVADTNGEDVDGPQIHAVNDTIGAEVDSKASPELINGDNNADDECSGTKSNNEIGIEIKVKREFKVESETEIEMMDNLPFIEFDPNNANESFGEANSHAPIPESLEIQSQPSTSLNEQKQSKSNDGKRFKCKDCAYTTRYRSNFQRHQLIHNNDKPFKCEHCDYAARQKGTLKSHQLTHDRQNLMGIVQDPNNGLYKCTHCDQQFLKWASFTSHFAKSHKSNQRLFNCERCMRLFEQKTSKERHEIRCQNRHYECHLCKKYVARNVADMQRHMRTHSGAKPFKCTVCERYFRVEYNLKSHLNRIHGRNSI